MTYAVHNLATRAIEIDEDGSYAVQPDGPRFNVAPLATFETFDLAEEWREARLAEMRGDGR